MNIIAWAWAIPALYALFNVTFFGERAIQTSAHRVRRHAVLWGRIAAAIYLPVLLGVQLAKVLG